MSFPAPWGAYIAGHASNTSTSLYDFTGNGRNATMSGVTSTSGAGNGAAVSIPYITGGTSNTITWPTGSIPTTFTICSIARYTGTTNRRIFDGSGGNWLHGHWQGVAGVAYYNQWMTQTSASSTNVSLLTDWLVMCGKNGTGVATPNNILVNGVGNGTATGGTGNYGLSINNGPWGETSTFAFQQVIIWDQALTASQMLQVSNLMTSYLATCSITYPWTGAPSFGTAPITPIPSTFQQNTPSFQVQMYSATQIPTGTYQLTNTTNSTTLATKTFSNVNYNLSTTNAQFYSCVGVDDQSRIHVLQFGTSAVSYNNRMLIYNMSGTLLNTVSSPISRNICLGNLYFESTTKNLYLPTIGYDDVSGIDFSLNTLYWFNTTSQTFSSVVFNNTVTGVTSDLQGYLYISNSGQKIIRYRLSDSSYSTIFDNAVSSSFTGSVYFTGIVLAKDGYLYTLNNIGNIFKFTTAGTFVGLFATQNNTDRYTALTYNSYADEFYCNYNNGYANPNTIYRMPLSTKTVTTAYSSSNTWGVTYFPVNCSCVFDPYTASVFAMVESSTTGTFMVQQFSYMLLFSSVPTTNLTIGTNTLQMTSSGFAFSATSQVTIIALYPCFLEGTQILRMNTDTDTEEYAPVETLKPGDLIRTVRSGYKAIQIIGKRVIDNRPDSDVKNRLFVFRKDRVKGLFEDLYVTGEHCTLLYNVSDKKLKEVEKYMGRIYVTEGDYRVPAHLDDRAEPADLEGDATIWHFALEHDDPYANYGVFANGLLVESSSVRYMAELANMDYIE